jgi:hypothetical protein
MIDTESLEERWPGRHSPEIMSNERNGNFHLGKEIAWLELPLDICQVAMWKQMETQGMTRSSGGVVGGWMRQKRL